MPEDLIVPTTQSHGTQKTLLIILSLVILVLLGLVGYLFKNPSSSQNTSNTNMSAALPADPSASSVASVALSYEYRGTISEIKKDPRGLVLVTDITAVGTPEFIIDGGTKSYMFSKGKEVPMNASVVKVGDKVTLFERYDLSSKTWKLTKLDVLVEVLPTPTASPKLPKITKTPAPSPKP